MSCIEISFLGSFIIFEGFKGQRVQFMCNNHINYFFNIKIFFDAVFEYACNLEAVKCIRNRYVGSGLLHILCYYSLNATGYRFLSSI